jgi:hypothetical protein
LVLFVKETGFAFFSVAVYIGKSPAADFNRNKTVEMRESMAASMNFLSEMSCRSLTMATGIRSLETSLKAM